jgi:hypothetical protein
LRAISILPPVAARLRLAPSPLARALFSARSWAGAWRRGPSRDGPSIAVIGNCQGRGVARSIELLCPGSRVTSLPTARLRRDFRDAETLARALSGHDLVVAQVLPDGLLPGGFPALRTGLPRLSVYPTFVFSAFHPDMIYVGHGGSREGFTPSPLGLYHSALAVFGFLRGLDEARTLRLFREDIFARLGYLDGWDASARALLAAASADGCPVEREFLRWSRRGCFMHGINHPKLFVLGDIARRLLAEAGLPARDVEPEAYLPDDLVRDVVWPVYPPLAERYGLPGSYLFKDKVRGSGPATLHDLPGFVAASFRTYRATPRARLDGPRMRAWAADPTVTALFDAA